MLTLLFALIAILALCAAWGATRFFWPKVDPNMCAANSYGSAVSGTHTESVTKRAEGALASYLLVKLGTDAWHVLVADADDTAVGVTDDSADAAEDPLAVLLLTPGHTRKLTALTAITAGYPVYQAAGGKVASSGVRQIGIAMVAAAADGDIIEVQTSIAIGSSQLLSFPVTLSTLANGDWLTNFPLTFAGTITSVSFQVTVAVTTAAKAATLNLEINTTNVTGGVVALTSANCTPIGAVVAGTAITAANTFAAGDTLSIEVASVTTFVEGAGIILITYTA